MTVSQGIVSKLFTAEAMERKGYLQVDGMQDRLFQINSGEMERTVDFVSCHWIFIKADVPKIITAFFHVYFYSILLIYARAVICVHKLHKFW